MPHAYPSEFRDGAVALIKAGRSVAQTAIDLEIAQTTIYMWIKQNRIDRVELPGVTTSESKEFRAARRLRVADWHVVFAEAVDVSVRFSDAIGCADGADEGVGEYRKLGEHSFLAENVTHSYSNVALRVDFLRGGGVGIPTLPFCLPSTSVSSRIPSRTPSDISRTK